MASKRDPTPMQRAAVLFVAALAENVDENQGILAANGTPRTRAKVAALVRKRFFGEQLTMASETTMTSEEAIGFCPVTPETPRHEWLLVRWRNTTTGQWMLPVVARNGGPLWWDGKRDWQPEGDEVQWCRIPREATRRGLSPQRPEDANDIADKLADELLHRGRRDVLAALLREFAAEIRRSAIEP